MVQGGRRVRAVQGRGKRQPPGAARQGRRAGRHRALRRADGHPEGRARQRRAEPDPERRRRMPPPARCARPTCSAPRSPTRSRRWRWARPWWTRATRRPSGSPGSTRPATRPSKASSESYTKAGGTIVKELGLPFPNVEFQALLTEIASLQARRRGLLLRRRRRRQVHPRLRRGGPQGQDPAVRLGLPDRRRARRRRPGGRRHHHHACTTATRWTRPRNKQFRLAYAKTFRMQPDVYAVQGYDTGQLLVAGRRRRQGRPEQQAGAVQGAWSRPSSTARAASGP